MLDKKNNISASNQVPPAFMITANHLVLTIIGIVLSILLAVGIYLAIQHGIFDKIFNILHQLSGREAFLVGAAAGFSETTGIALAILIGYKLANRSDKCEENRIALGD